MLCVITAMRRESRLWERRLTNRRILARRPCRAMLAERHDRRVLLLTTGIGERSTRAGLEWLFDRRDHPFPEPITGVIAAGFLGGLHPDLKVGDIVVADRVRHPDGRWLAAMVPGIVPQDGFPMTVGPIVTSGEVVASADAKRSLYERIEAIGVDMESAIVVESCRQRGIPCCVIRSISDVATTAVPAEVLAMIGSDRPRWLRLLAGVLRRPALTGEIATLARGSRLAAASLAYALDRLCYTEDGEHHP